MTPQGHLTVWAPITDEAALRSLLQSMNRQPGVVDPDNALVPFSRLDTVHFSRFVILDDRTVDDIRRAYHQEPPPFTLALAFLADFDGPRSAFIDDLLRVAGDGLGKIFACCGFDPRGGDLRAWIGEHSLEPAANYVNWIGRTRLQVREEAKLRDFLCTWLRGPGVAAVANLSPVEIHKKLRELVKGSDVKLTPAAPTPLGYRVRHAASFLAALALIPLLLLFSPILIPLLLLYTIVLRWREIRDPEVDERADRDRIRLLAELEDHDITNQFTAMGTLKPGAFRLFTISTALVAANWAARHLYGRGHLARVRSIHFARWVFIDDRKRLFFASNYDGSLESYMDDFINKVGFGLNLVFSNGIGYPRVKYLILGGAKDEQKFKRYIRRHQLPTEVWYDPHPGLTAVDLARNTRIREGLERRHMTETQAREWLQLF